MSIKKGPVLIMALLCLMLSVVLLSGSSVVSADTGDSDSGIITYEAYASDFKFSDENNVNYNVKWEISYTSDFEVITGSCDKNVFDYVYPYETGTFYVKEYISDSMTFEEDETTTQVIEIIVSGVAPTVTFDSEGGSSVPSASVPYYVGNPQTVNEPTDPTRSGYAFAGWCLADGTEYDFSTPVTSDITLYASWTEDKTIMDTLLFGPVLELVILILLAVLVLYFIFKKKKRGRGED